MRLLSPDTPTADSVICTGKAGPACGRVLVARLGIVSITLRDPVAGLNRETSFAVTRRASPSKPKATARGAPSRANVCFVLLLRLITVTRLLGGLGGAVLPKCPTTRY